MFRLAACIAVLLGFSCLAGVAMAQATVECYSHDYQYDECWAGPLDQPQLVHQISSSPCIVNSTWGYNRRSGYIWVAQGCAGVFADVGGYHHGRGDTWDRGARRYNHRGHDVGAVAAGAVIGAIIGAAASGKNETHHHSTTNIHWDSDDKHSGCHGLGCKVDNPDNGNEIDPRPQFDREGNPNFDTEGNWQGCHGVGCLVDTPKSDDNN